MQKHYYLLILFSLLFNSSYSQKKKLTAKPVVKNVTISKNPNEGILNLKNANEIATDFVMYEPDNGKEIPNEKKTEVTVSYDNTAIYFSAVLYDDEPNKISREITNRDVFGISDHFSVHINGFNDGQQEYRFYVSAAGVQMDCIATEDNEDFTWNAIWYSKVKITDVGWTVEMKIPYAALRFLNSDKQTWGLNFMREIKRNYQKYSWNYIDTKIGSVINQSGLLEGIENIKPPTRLFLIPYTSAYYQQDNFVSDRTLKAGLDIKYGINDSFTLDAILVPDFGQTKFDNAILNLEPFEQTLTENRPFFTEGIDLFNKGNLFYSRRIGGTASKDQYNLESELAVNETITKYPVTVNLINAIKLSGRTKGGLGIGVLNAITEKTFATIKNTVTEKTREEVIEPLTNYNIIVLDQRFRQNSSVTFLNTNTTRNGGEFRDANVSEILFDLNTKGNSYNLFGDFKYSTINDDIYTNGFKTELGFAKTSGKYRYEFSGKYISKNYDTNDLGLLFYNNYHSAFACGSYRIVNPTKTFNTFKVKELVNLEFENTTGRVQSAVITTELVSSTINNNLFEFILDFNPLKTFDFYEARNNGESFFRIPEFLYSSVSFTTNPNKPFSIAIKPSLTSYNQKGSNVYNLNLEPKIRFNNRFSLAFTADYTLRKNDRGWSAFDGNDIIFSQRDRQILQNDLTGKYALSNTMTLNLTARYYWSYSDIEQFFTLQKDGTLNENNSYSQSKNRNFNSWNFDLSYSWWFAPGSELSFLYRNYVQTDTNVVEKKLSTNFRNTFDSNLTSIISLSFRYFIDYNSLKKKH